MDGRLAAEGREQHGGRGPLCRDPLAAVVADLQLQRDQHRRERIPQRVQAGPAEPGGQHRAANLGNTFRYTGAPGTSPLPIFLAHFQGLPASAAGNPSNYSATNANWTNATFLGYLAKYNPTPYNFANTGNDRLIGNGTFRSNALAAGLPANFFQVNPDLIGGANIVGNGGATYYNSLQLELRKRLAQGLQFQTSYVFGQQDETTRYSLRYPRERVRDTGTEGGVAHAFRANWVYELPFGQGRRFASGAGPWMNRLVGGWSLDGIARFQSGTTLDFGNVRLVGMSTKELQDAFKLRFDDVGKLVYMLPQDIIDNTVRAYQRQRHFCDRLQRSRRADGTIYRSREWSGLHRDRAGLRQQRERPDRLWRLRRSLARRHRPDAGAVRSEHVQTHPDQGQHERRVPCGAPERLQLAVVRGGHWSEQQHLQQP